MNCFGLSLYPPPPQKKPLWSIAPLSDPTAKPGGRWGGGGQNTSTLMKKYQKLLKWPDFKFKKKNCRRVCRRTGGDYIILMSAAASADASSAASAVVVAKFSH